MKVASLLALNLSLILTASAASGPVIGVATANGSFRVDNARVTGNTTVFEGAVVETEDASSRVRLNNGTRVELATGSRATVYGNRALLARGLGELETASGYQMEARGLRVATGAAKSVARVRLEGDKTVLVAAVNGPVRVLNRDGLLLANVPPGSTLSFQPQARQEGAFQLSGCLLRKASRFILVDQTANVTVELRGDAAQLTPQLGNRVQIGGTAVAGAQPVAGATQVLQVTSMEQVGPGGCVAAAAAVGADRVPGAPGAPPPEAKGKGHGAIIAGVLIGGAGGAIGGIVAASRSKSKSP